MSLFTDSINAKTLGSEDAKKVENILAALIVDTAVKVHRTLGGPGLLENKFP